ncbi:BPSS1187 family protein [Chryseobacterium sp. DT-3]|uniref:BPSS1187 family protein n=1 Tax=Chryseobacterium sp. DT-3 TaxID=3396164 RepID=UPI003F1C6F7E
MKKKILLSTISFILMFIISSSVNLTAQKISPVIDFSGYKILKVKPSEADPSVKNWDSVHVVYYDKGIKNNKVLLWLTGTNGTTNHVPKDFFKTALDQGYRIIALSFISSPGVSQVCVGDYLNKNVDCAAEFRRKRIYGDNVFLQIPDQYQDAIIPRLIKLLQYLTKNDKEGSWSQYLNQTTGKPVWSKIAIAGQSQGGGMGELPSMNRWRES